MRTLTILAVVSIMMFSSCNKTKQNSNRLSGEEWKVVSMTIGGEAEEEDHLPTFEFSDCDIYDEVCMAEWYIEDEHAEFAWQFNEKGEKFIISNQSEADHDHDHDHDEEGDHDHDGDHNEDGDHEEHVEPVDQCQELSGTYDVVEMKRKTMIIESNTTLGHEGELVKMELEKVD